MHSHVQNIEFDCTLRQSTYLAEWLFLGFLNGHMLDFYAGGKGRIIAKSNVTVEDIFDIPYRQDLRTGVIHNGNKETYRHRKSKG